MHDWPHKLLLLIIQTYINYIDAENRTSKIKLYTMLLEHAYAFTIFFTGINLIRYPHNIILGKEVANWNTFRLSLGFVQRCAEEKGIESATWRGKKVEPQYF